MIPNCEVRDCPWTETGKILLLFRAASRRAKKDSQGQRQVYCWLTVDV